LAVGKTELKMVATDSYRLSEKRLKIKDSDTTLEEIIVPLTTMLEVSRIFTKSEQPIEVIISKNQILFSQDSIHLTSRLIEGRFPEYTQILAIKRVSLFARENSYNIRLQVQQGAVLISSNATEIGEDKTEVAAQVKGEDGAIALNAQYLIDFLNNVADDTILFDIDTKLTPAVLRPKKKDDYLYLVMPLKLD
jgi:DNA polymerase III subunit beta